MIRAVDLAPAILFSAIQVCCLIAVGTTVCAQPLPIEPAISVDPRKAWLERVERSRQSYDAFIARVRLASPAQALRGPARDADYLADPTLHAGDVVVTQAGLLVFHGSDRFPHQGGDFESLRARTGLKHTRELLEIERLGQSRTAR